ncbi:MAG TPA: MbcA/ParS/Xre antitoxin family protein [Telluria sp.]
MTDDNQVTPGAFAALQASFQKQSRKAQAYYTAMHAIRTVLKSEDAASAWMEHPLAAFGGRTPAELVAAGREQEVLNHIAALRP